MDHGYCDGEGGLDGRASSRGADDYGVVSPGQGTCEAYCEGACP